MSVDLGPRLGLLINADIGEEYVDQFRPFLRAIDALLFGSVLNSSTTTPPSSPANGAAYLLLGTPTGAWTGQANSIAVWSTEITTNGTNTKVPGWEFFTPNAGWLVWNTALTEYQQFNGTAWVPLQTPALTLQVALAPSSPGNFTVAQSLGSVPSAVTIEMTSGGQIWFQSTRYDASNLYLVASDAGLTGYAKVWK